ncbi:hypothetical protein LCGC14_1624620 [marine sediment metagenome]|uniref:Uncharacterized protein n=1 Tax=marine sediment metagenome TaxID=412755 RepID=A0A0F9L450_9ZZZZ
MNYDKEDIYDEQIAPLMMKIIKICKQHELPMVSTFCYKVSEEGEESLCTTWIPMKDNWLPEALLDCRKRLYKRHNIVAFAIMKPPPVKE